MLEVLFTPAEFNALSSRNLSDTVCVVFDVLRATSSMVTALANGARVIIPVEDISDALAYRKFNPEVLLAGERGGLRISGRLTGGTPFDLGNSPREFTREQVKGREIVMTTTNGTRALRACINAKRVLVSCFLNISATAIYLEMRRPKNLLLICSGTYEQAAYEDTIAAGALCDRIWRQFSSRSIADSALIARNLFRSESGDIETALARSKNARRLLARPELREDVAFCLQIDAYPCLVSRSRNGGVRKMRTECGR